MAVRKDFLGRGWAFPFHIDPASGSPAMSEFEENIRQCMTIILGTRPGERQMMPTFGCRVHELLFAPNTAVTARKASRFVEDALRQWEPRIQVMNVKSIPDPSGSLQIEVTYKIPSTGSVDHLIQIVSNL